MSRSLRRPSPPPPRPRPPPRPLPPPTQQPQQGGGGQPPPPFWNSNDSNSGHCGFYDDHPFDRPPPSQPERPLPNPSNPPRPPSSSHWGMAMTTTTTTAPPVHPSHPPASNLHPSHPLIPPSHPSVERVRVNDVHPSHHPMQSSHPSHSAAATDDDDAAAAFFETLDLGDDEGHSDPPARRDDPPPSAPTTTTTTTMPPPPPHGSQRAIRDEEEEEVPGVALQTALAALDNLGTLASGMVSRRSHHDRAGAAHATAGNAANGAAATSAAEYFGSGLSPAKLAGSMARWRGRLADVVAPVEGPAPMPAEATEFFAGATGGEGGVGTAAVSSAGDPFGGPPPAAADPVVGDSSSARPPLAPSEPLRQPSPSPSPSPNPPPNLFSSPSSPSPPRPSEAPSPRRYRLPPKPRLPLPPPLPPRRKPAGDGWGGGSAAGSSLGGDGPSLTSASTSSRFRKPPPLEVRAAAKTTTTLTTPLTTTRPTLPTTTTTVASPLASPRNAPTLEKETSRTVARTTAAGGEFEFKIDRAPTTVTDDTTMTAKPTTTTTPTVEEHPPARDSAPPEKEPNAVAAAAIADEAVQEAIRNVTTPNGNGAEVRTSSDDTAAFPSTSPKQDDDDEDEGLPDVESSRITECDALSDYQSYVLDEDVPPAEDEQEDAPSMPRSQLPDDTRKALERPPEEEEPSNQQKDVRLAEGWVEGTDPASGRTYYYHRVTNESTWDRPVAAMAGIEREPTPSAVSGGVGDGMEDGTGIEDGLEDGIDNGKEDGMESTKDQAADQPADQHVDQSAEFGQATPVDRPSGDQFDNDNDDDYDDHTNLSFESLPPGWIEGRDPISGKTYYYDERTGESAWTLPAEAFAASRDDRRTANAGEEGETASSPEGEETECGGVVPSIENEGREERDVATTHSLSEKAMEASLPIRGVDETAGPNFLHPDVQQPLREGDPTNLAGDDVLDPSLVDDSSSVPIDRPLEPNAPPLPTNWIELVDPSSGRTYYVNEETRESTWTRPRIDDPSTVATDSAEGGGTQDDVGGDDLVDGAKSTDAGEGSIAEGSIAENAVATDESVPDGDLRSDNVDESLPPGWIELEDPSTGRTYYFHEQTGMSSWEIPVANRDVDATTDVAEPETRPNDVMDEEVEHAEEPEESKEASHDVHRDDDNRDHVEEMHVSDELGTVGVAEESAGPGATTTNSMSPEGWVELVDPGSGHVYYCNQITGETTWERPQSMEDVAFPDVYDATAGGDETEQEAEVEPNHELPMALDGNSNAFHVPNGLEKEEPDVMAETGASTVESDVKGDSSTGQDVGSPLQVPSSEQPSFVIYAHNQDDGTFTHYKFAAGDRSEVEEESVGVTTTDTDPIQADVSPELQEELPQPGTSALSESNKPLDEQLPPLPIGWVQALDPGSGNVYYYNEDTNEATWERPQPYEASEPPKEQDDEVKVDVVPADEEGKEEKSNDYEKSPEISKDTSDNIPETDNQDNFTSELEPTPKEESPGALQSLPPGWAESIDPQSGKVYYYNEITNEATWDRPVAEESKETMEGARENDDVQEISHNTSSEGRIDAECVENELPEKLHADKFESTNDVDDDALPDGWARVIDETSGNPYYVNNTTGATSWDRPKTSHVQNETVDEKNDDAVTGSLKDVSSPGSLQPMAEDEPSMPSIKPAESGEELAPGWKSVVDEISGNTYYFHEVSGETTWTKPVAPATEAADDNPSAEIPPQHEVIKQTQRCRPAHAIASFGFGGKLCVMFPQVAKSLSGAMTSGPAETISTPTMRRGPVVIHKVRDLIPLDHKFSIPSPMNARKSDKSTLPRNRGPLIKSREDDVLSLLEEKSARPDALLWNLVKIDAHAGGQFRRDDKAQTEILDLLMNDSEDAKKLNSDNSCSPSPAKAPKYPSNSGLEEIQNLLLRGNREEAVSEALDNKNYPLALLVASMCNQLTYQIAVRRFADETLSSGSPLHTFVMLSSYQLEAPSTEALLDPNSESFWCGDSYKNLAVTWKYQLACILSNRTSGWEKIVLALGDRLMQLGECHPAHFCYLVCGVPFRCPSDKSTRLTLLGCDHRIPMHQQLMTPEAIESFERTEAFEWAKRKGNRRALLPSLQRLKLRYAKLLADFGHEELALKYIINIRTCTGIWENEKGSASVPSSGNAPIAIYTPEFISELKILEDRLCVSIGVTPSWKKGKKTTGRGSYFGSMVKNYWSSKSIRLEDTKPEEHKPESSIPEDYADPSGQAATILGESIRKPRNVPDVVEETTDAKKRETMNLFVPPKMEHMEDASSGEIVTKTADANSFIQRPFVQEKTGPDDITKIKEDNDVAQPSASAPPSYGENVVDRAEDLKPLGEKVEPSPMSFPKPATKQDSKKAPVSEPPRSAGWLSRLLGRDSESKAKVADVGEDMQAYYDEKLKRWIFPGDDPAEVAKPLAPPPIMSTPKPDALPEKAPEEERSNDPLAALMAPPSRAPSAKKGSSIPSKTQYMNPVASMGNVPFNPSFPKSSSINGTDDGAVSNQVPPKFSVFQPKPAKADKQENN